MRPSAPIDAPRPTGSSAAMSSSALLFGQPVTEPPGNTAGRRSVSGTAGRGAASRQIVPLQIDDHHVLGVVLLRLDRNAGGTSPLDRRGADDSASLLQQQLRRGGDDRPALALQGSG